MHSSIDLIASIVAFFSVREADKPADDDHPYGHDEDREPRGGDRGAADPRRLRRDRLRGGPPPGQRHRGALARHRHRRDRVLGRSPTSSSRRCSPAQRARRPTRRRSRATPPTCAPTRRPRPASCSASSSCRSPARPGWIRSIALIGRRRDRLRRRAAARCAPRACSSTRRCRPTSSTRCARRSTSSARAASAASTSCARAARASRRYVDLHVQFVARHDARGRARHRPPAAGRDPRAPARRRRADPPRARGQRASRAPRCARRTRARQRRLIAADSPTATASAP